MNTFPPVDMTTAINELIKLYIQQLTDPWDYETAGCLGISIDRREDFKYKYIKPSVPGFAEAEACYAPHPTREQEDEIIIPFEDATEERLRKFEQTAQNVIVAKLQETTNMVDSSIVPQASH